MLSSLAAAVIAAALFIAWESGGRLRRSVFPACAVIAWFGGGLVRAAAANVHLPREWDYGCFWLYAHVAAAHLNIYDPAAYAQIASPWAPTDDFRTAVLEVGFPYPPPSLALFIPLTWIASVPAGLAFWYAMQGVALVGASWVLARVFFPADGLRGALFVLAATCVLPASLANVNNAQTNFVLLLLLALTLQARARSLGGMWEILAMWVKPYAGVLLLLDLVRGRWRRLAVALATVVGSLAAAALALGPQTLLNYVRSNPSTREPAYAFVEIYNQSLLAVVLRSHGGVSGPHVAALHEPLYVIGALALAAITIAVSVRPGVPRDVAFAAMLLLGLIVYPGTLSSYGVVMIVPLLIVWRYRDAFPGGALTAAAIVGLVTLGQSGSLLRDFEAAVLAWLACSYLALFARADARDEQRPTPSSFATGVSS